MRGGLRLHHFAVGISISLALAVSLPSMAAVDDTLGGTLAIKDGLGDLRDPRTGEPQSGPGHLDLTGVSVSALGDTLTVRFDLADAIPNRTGVRFLARSYTLDIDSYSDEEPDSYVEVVFGSGLEEQGAPWRATLRDYASLLITPLDNVAITDDSLSVTVPAPTLGPRRGLSRHE